MCKGKKSSNQGVIGQKTFIQAKRAVRIHLSQSFYIYSNNGIIYFLGELVQMNTRTTVVHM